MTEPAFFRSIYSNADGDADKVPWADCAPKQHLVEWLGRNDGYERSALDVACGLGDNAEVLSQSGWNTSAFDFSKEAIDWASARFPNSAVQYRTADLFQLPPEWQSAFDLVWECYTIQSFEPADQHLVAQKIAGLVCAGGTLLVYAMTRPAQTPVSGPPFPLQPKQEEIFASLNFDLRTRTCFSMQRGERQVDHSFSVWEKRY